MNTTTRRLTGGVAAAAAALLIALLPSVAHADESSDVSDVWLSAQDLRVNSGACRTARLKMHHNGGHLERIAAEVEIWKGSRYVGETFDFLYDSSAPLTVEHLWCPYEGLGRFRAGPSDVEWSYTVETSHWDSYLEMWITDTDYREGDLRDRSQASFLVKQDARLSRPTGRTSGRTRTLSTKLTHYNVGASQWKAMKKAPVKLQRRPSNGRGQWKTIKSVRTSSTGRATATAKATKKFQYRFAYSGSGTTWSRTSAAVRR
ncbi:hypothetical protein H1W00_07825 [Aeromicrobium sp. Marseille-Q0843]|uniref:DUF427 domain-containing protein n=1 Tax=Aeromicrobium phoceense TaxID=2754045 RepID=A0A838XHF7_9ACTN|nr:hypothetical protein [Aeromicrobium phoceense]MBA4608381.1 hypothetical protein [Aeromicrobium phoceense]